MLASLIFTFVSRSRPRPDQTKPLHNKEIDFQKSPDTRYPVKLGEACDLAILPAIQYAYDPLPALPRRSNCRLYQLFSGSTGIGSSLSLNSVKLDPLSAGLPYRCSIDHVRASKFWQENLGETTTLLELLAADQCASDIEDDHGITVAKLAKRALTSDLEHQMVLTTHYMFPGADAEKIKQIAALMILYFVFDDKVEETPDKALHIFRCDFLRRLQGPQNRDSTPSALQRYMDEIIHGIESHVTSDKDGGREMLEALRRAFRCVHPPEKGFQTVREYFDFRRLNVGAEFVIAAVKFSIQSSVSLSDHRFTRYFSLVGDHLGLVNDLASFDKELRALNQGETSDMINLVAVVKHVTLLQGNDDAKSVVWALQLQLEQQMMEELERLQAVGLTDEEWLFLEAVASAVVGNVMFCMTTARYGGEAARIPKS